MQVFQHSYIGFYLHFYFILCTNLIISYTSLYVLLFYTAQSGYFLIHYIDFSIIYQIILFLFLRIILTSPSDMVLISIEDSLSSSTQYFYIFSHKWFISHNFILSHALLHFSHHWCEFYNSTSLISCFSISSQIS